MTEIRLIALSVFLTAALGCRDNSAQVESPVGPDRASANSPPETPATTKPAAQPPGYWDRVTSLYEQAKASGETSAANARDWIAELYGSAKSSGAATASETSAWVSGLYDRAKQSGETSADTVKEWVMDDIQQIDSWQYKTLQVRPADVGDTMNDLNRLGAERWECFWVQENADVTTFYLKRAGRSYLRHLPSKELIRLLPLLSGGRATSEE